MTLGPGAVGITRASADGNSYYVRISTVTVHGGS